MLQILKNLTTNWFTNLATQLDAFQAHKHLSQLKVIRKIWVLGTKILISI